MKPRPKYRTHTYTYAYAHAQSFYMVGVVSWKNFMYKLLQLIFILMRENGEN